MFLSGDSHEDSNGASSSSFLIPFSSPVDSSQDLSIISPFSRFKYLLLTVLLIFIHFSLFNCSGVLKISRRFVFPLCIRSSSFEDVISFKSFNSTGATSLLNHFNGVSFEWALTHRSFPRILPDSSYFPGVTLKFFSKFDVRMSYHQSNAFLQDLSNSFHSWLNLFAFDSSGVPQ